MEINKKIGYEQAMQKLSLSLTLICLATFLAGCSEKLNTTLSNSLKSKSKAETLINADAETNLEIGLDHITNQRYEMAKNKYLLTINKHGPSKQAILGVAAAYDYLNEFSKADGWYDVYKKSYGADINYLNNLGYSFILRDDLVKAELMLRQAKNLASDNAVVNGNIKLVDMVK